MMNKENLIKFGLISLVFVIGSLIVIHFTGDYQQNVSTTAYWVQSLMYALIGLILGIKSFKNKINWNMKVSDVVIGFILIILILLHPFYLRLLPFGIAYFLITANVNIVSSILLGYFVGNSLN